MREVPGPGPVLACLPGLQGDARVFEDFARASGRRTLLFDLPAGSPRRAGFLLATRVPTWLEGSADWLTGSFGGLVLRTLPESCVRSAAVVASLPGPELIRRRTRVQASALAALPPPLVAVSYRAHLRRALAADGVPPPVVARITRRGLDPDVLRDRLEGVLRWDVAPPPATPFVTVLGDDDPQARWSDDAVSGPVIRVPGGHRPWCSHPQALLDALAPLWA